ncbi:MAG TPA: metal-dependent hydrolase [Accumulibacter sp.]|nr:metal-dependent hydrolase [Accumulibacter sp.]HMW17131.1 metal-dependent hydrolase [Accumulibacter sp.]HMX22382.1 metal-dependent hydrolase [Accumulibacter sp.]HMY05836.1 metal-dependent hydrolase [Accumulibacter sp.]HNC17438.1 metal-dependent hydrolase [Accumulibacter sp.]
MPSVLSHIAVPIAARIGLGPSFVTRTLLLLGLLAAVLPDADVLLLHRGVAYGSTFGHRGASHSILFALLIATLFAILYVRNKWQGIGGVWAYLFLCALSHPLLDACTNAGHGAALFWPWSDSRVFFPFRPIETSPLNVHRFFGEAGLRVLRSELLWIWAPCLFLGVVVNFWSHKRHVSLRLAGRYDEEFQKRRV